jgi:hypothetical protein
MCQVRTDPWVIVCLGIVLIVEKEFVDPGRDSNSAVRALGDLACGGTGDEYHPEQSSPRSGPFTGREDKGTCPVLWVQGR